jgi:hypothetical protein
MSRSRADVFGNVGKERDDVVVGRALDLAMRLTSEFRAALDGREVFPGILRASQARISIWSQMENLFSSVQISRITSRLYRRIMTR